MVTNTMMSTESWGQNEEEDKDEDEEDEVDGTYVDAGVSLLRF